jgi:hypothetical protein
MSVSPKQRTTQQLVRVWTYRATMGGSDWVNYYTFGWWPSTLITPGAPFAGSPPLVVILIGILCRNATRRMTQDEGECERCDEICIRKIEQDRSRRLDDVLGLALAVRRVG